MKILGIDTSAYLNSVGLVDGREILADYAWEAMDNSLQRIVQVIDSVLADQGLTLDDIDGLGVGTGPGSWTGVRIGVTVAKTFAYATGKPLCGIPSLDALAWQARDTAARICPLIDGGRETVFAAFYHPRKDNIARTGDYYAGSLGQLLENIDEPTLFLGSAAGKYRQIIEESLGPLALYRDDMEEVQRSSAVAMLALSRLERGGRDDALSLVPLYLRESAAQARLVG